MSRSYLERLLQLSSSMPLSVRLRAFAEMIRDAGLDGSYEILTHEASAALVAIAIGLKGAAEDAATLEHQFPALIAALAARDV